MWLRGVYYKYQKILFGSYHLGNSKVKFHFRSCVLETGHEQIYIFIVIHNVSQSYISNQILYKSKSYIPRINGDKFKSLEQLCSRYNYS